MLEIKVFFVYLIIKFNENCFRTDPVINQQLTESMWSVEGLKFLHQDSHVVMLPKGLPSIGHNVSIEFIFNSLRRKKKCCVDDWSFVNPTLQSLNWEVRRLDEVLDIFLIFNNEMKEFFVKQYY